MKVSLNTSYNNIKSLAFRGNNSKNYTDNEIITAKTKKVVSECTTVAIGMSILYFAMKSHLMGNKIDIREQVINPVVKFMTRS